MQLHSTLLLLITTSLTLIPATSAKPAKHESWCEGSHGEPDGSYACVDVIWEHYDNVVVAVNVTDTTTNGHDAYAWYRMYQPNGKYQDSEKLIDIQGSGVHQDAFPWDGKGTAWTGLRLWACQNDAGSDTCKKGTWKQNPKA